MPKYFISVTVYATYEHANKAEIEAESAEEAGKKFEELVAQRANGVIDLSQPLDQRPIVEGFYSVYVVPPGVSLEDLTDNELEIDGEQFSGARQ